MAFDETTKLAAIHLGQRLGGMSWYSSVGITEEDGMPLLIIYSRRALPKSSMTVPELWEGIKVRVQRIGKVVPAHPRVSPPTEDST